MKPAEIWAEYIEKTAEIWRDAATDPEMSRTCRFFLHLKLVDEAEEFYRFCFNERPDRDKLMNTYFPNK
jgi:hypothetical protein